MDHEENGRPSPDPREHPTQGFPAQGPPYQPVEPQWSVPAPTVVGRMNRNRLLLAIGIGVTVVLVLALVAVVRSGSPGGGTRAVAAQRPTAGFDLRQGGVFLQSNDERSNEVAAFARGQDGKLREAGRYQTGGAGSGSFEDSAQGIVLGTADGETSPQHHLDKADLLFVPNAGSNTISVFRVRPDHLELAGQFPSGGETPVSLTVNHGLLYVLNSGEFDNRYILNFQADEFLDNCTTGQRPSVTGFRVSGDGTLAQIKNSTQLLSGDGSSGCAQVSFTPDGKHLVVTERAASLPDKTPGKGAIVTFGVNANGTLGGKQVMDPSGTGPFGFTTTRDGHILVSENNHEEEGGAFAASYTMRGDGTLKTNGGGSVPDKGTDACWIVATNDGQLAFTANAFGGGTISSYGVDTDGTLTLLHSSATASGQDPSDDHLSDGTTDMALSRDSRYLYQLNSIGGVLHVFRVNSSGTLTFIEDHQVFTLTPIEAGGQAAPFGLAAF
jgi:6-phosphogluconolactonase